MYATLTDWLIACYQDAVGDKYAAYFDPESFRNFTSETSGSFCGIGVSALMGARAAGAERIFAIDPLENKRELAPTFGATHAVASLEEAQALVGELTWGANADKVLITTGSVISTKVFEGKGVIVNIDDGKSGFPVWVPDFTRDDDKAQINPGDLIEATGKIKLFKGKLELEVNKKGMFKIVSKVSTSETTEEE